MLIYRGSFSVFSTSVEVILRKLKIIVLPPCILHECGGDPNIGGLFGGSDKVFSTSVEVILD